MSTLMVWPTIVPWSMVSRPRSMSSAVRPSTKWTFASAGTSFSASASCCEGPQHDALAENDVPAEAKVHLVEGRTAELIERGLDTIDHGTIVGHTIRVDIERRGHRKRPRTLELRNRRSFQLPRQLKNTRQHEAMPDIFA